MSLSIPLCIEMAAGLGAPPQPITIGVPLPRGALADAAVLALVGEDGRPLPLQIEVLARWSDGSIQWLLLDFLLEGAAESTVHQFRVEPAERPAEPEETIRVDQNPGLFVVDTGRAAFEIDRGELFPLRGVRLGELDVLPDLPTDIALTHGEVVSCPKIEHSAVESAGPVRATLSFEGCFEGCPGIRFRARLCFFAGTGLMRMRFTLHNIRRARHRGGLWDLGDPRSFLFGALLVELSLGDNPQQALWKPQCEQRLTEVAGRRLHLLQESSGGEHWASRNHVNRDGRVLRRFRGYQVQTGRGVTFGLRAEPVFAVRHENACCGFAIPEFWQQFPKAVEIDEQLVHIYLFPPHPHDQHELQGGEQKTHTVWFRFEPSTDAESVDLAWVHRPAQVALPPEWIAASGVFPQFLPASEDPDERLRWLMDAAVHGEQSFFAKRETIDEYGWRHFGEVYADHENAHYQGKPPVISHYNNQFDIVLGAMLQHFRTGEAAWRDVFDPLARHVADIDVYHTDEDRSAYNGGMFWLTDHYLGAETATHRTYSRRNKPGRWACYGGGPGAEHNYATGLLHYYYLTGDPEARDAMLGLAEWVLAMDDGKRTVLRVLDEGPTGLASATRDPDYHGPGRGAGNSINTLLDAWLLTGDRKYRDKAEELIRRTIHPADDIEARNLPDVEARWSYTMYLATLARYLDVKAERDELDFMYAYAQASLVQYAQWMAANEEPYFDHPEKLEYPTEAWAAQEFRKANALRLAARHADEPLRKRLLCRGTELADRAWDDLLRFDSRHSTRAIAVLMIEGMRDAYFRVKADAAAPKPETHHDFGQPQPFLPQRRRVKNQLKHPLGLARTLARLARPKNWRRIARDLWRR